MAKIRDSEEDVQPLLRDDSTELSNEIYQVPVNSVITKGVTIHLAKWPSHLFTIFTTVCIVSTAFIALTFVTIIFLSVDIKPRCRISRNIEIEEYPNLFFIRHTSHAWSRDQLCAIESSAREFPDLRVYLVNLSMHQSIPGLTVPVNTSLMLNFATAKDAVSALTERYTNVRSIDVVASAFFEKTQVEKVYDKFDGKILDIAVKSQLLWKYSGIALNTDQIDQIKYLRKYLCRSNETCSLKTAAITSDGTIQVSPLSCHAFFGFILKKLSKKIHSEEKIVGDTYKSFCPGHETCPGVEIFNNKFKNISEHLSCPLVFPTGF